jgi:Tfp pilus assembly protein PilE/DNA-directed RNA polymerase subunit RPC12/RpoP
MAGHKNKIKTVCPKCGKAFQAEEDNSHGDAPMAVCPKCKHVFFTKEPDDIDAEVFGEEEKGPIADVWSKRRQHKRYLGLLFVLLLAVISYQISSFLLQQNVLNESRDRSAQAVLSAVAKAQEAYFATAGTYALAITDLREYFRNEPSIVVEITQADAKNWTGTAYHKKSPNAYTFESNNGGLQPEPIPRPETEP